MAAKFGTSGLRGLVEDILDGTCERHVRGYLRHLVQSGQADIGDKIYVGYDFRPSSPEIAGQTFVAIKKEGLVPINCGDLPTPALALYAMENGSASIMITGSHIPADRNGIKFYRKDGEIDKSDEVAISSNAKNIDVNDLADITVDDVANAREEAISLFTQRYIDCLSPDSLAGKKIGIYEHSSVARDMMKDIFTALGAEITSLGRSESFIPVDTEAVSPETQSALKRWTKEYNLDAIASTDGDADRPLLSDEKGNCIKGDVLGFVSSQFLQADMIATPISSNSGIKSNDMAQVFNTRVGSPYVIAAMDEALERGGKRVVGFEANGGFLLASDVDIDGQALGALPTRDCILPILATLVSASQKGVTLSHLIESCDLPVTHAGRIQNFPTEIGQRLVSELTANSEKRDAFFQGLGAVAHCDTTDGLRVTLDDGQIVHLRPSGNAPEMRCYVEAQTMQGAEKLVEQTVEIIEKYRKAEGASYS